MKRIWCQQSESFVRIFCAAVAAFCLFSCGGGTSGTGLRTYQGKVLLPGDAPLMNGRLTVVEGGESANTDMDGLFSLQSSTLLPSVNLRVQSDNLDVEVPIDNIPEATTQVDVEVHVDPATNTGETTRVDFSSVEEFGVRARMIGACDRSFRNVGDDKIVQLGPLQDGFSCTVEVVVHGDGELQGGVLVGVERRACEPNSPWRAITSAITPTREHRGTVRIPFRYISSNRSCFYRIIAPQGDARRAQSVGIESLTGVGYDLEHPPKNP